MRLTMRQILMLNHAAAVNKLRMDEKIKRGRDKGDYDTLDEEVSDSVVFEGKRFDELTSDEYSRYMNS